MHMYMLILKIYILIAPYIYEGMCTHANMQMHAI